MLLLSRFKEFNGFPGQALQFYPDSPEQIEMATTSAMKAGMMLACVNR